MTDRRYTVSKFLSALSEPSLFLEEAERLVAKTLFRAQYGEGIDVVDRDWDNLIILDACRADYFSEYNDIDGDFQTVVSQGGHSEEFIKANFAGRELHDTILVTANPFTELLSDDVFFDVVYTDLFEQWDDSLKTIPPDAIVEATVEMHERHPDKRLIAHFMQPHAPYIGPTGQDLYERYEFGIFNPTVEDRAEFDVPSANIPQAVKQGPIEEEELRRAYTENVQIAIDHAGELVDQLDGKSVITADHGEMLGERAPVTKTYGHGSDIYASELRVVPWFVAEYDDRRDVTPGEPSGFEGLEDEIRESRLDASATSDASSGGFEFSGSTPHL